MRILKLVRNIFLAPTPTYVIFFVTSHCNARCRMCFNWRNIDAAGKTEELRLEEIKQVFDGFSGIQQLTVSGGEPFLRPDLPQILGYISHRNDMQMITVPTLLSSLRSLHQYLHQQEILR